MSQVNDALKRVRDTQQNAPRPGDVAPLRAPMPAPAPAPVRNVRLMLPIFFIAVALLALSLFLQLRQKQIVSARQPVATEKPVPVEVASANTKTTAPRPPAAPKASANASVAVAPVPTAMAPPAQVIKLQGILYAGRSSSAMISGQTVMVGDEVGGYRVAAIDQRSVTLVCATHTNVLFLVR